MGRDLPEYPTLFAKFADHPDRPVRRHRGAGGGRGPGLGGRADRRHRQRRAAASPRPRPPARSPATRSPTTSPCAAGSSAPRSGCRARCGRPSTPVGPTLVTTDEWQPGPDRHAPPSTASRCSRPPPATCSSVPTLLVSYVSTMITLRARRPDPDRHPGRRRPRPDTASATSAAATWSKPPSTASARLRNTVVAEPDGPLMVARHVTRPPIRRSLADLATRPPRHGVLPARPLDGSRTTTSTGLAAAGLVTAPPGRPRRLQRPRRRAARRPGPPPASRHPMYSSPQARSEEIELGATLRPDALRSLVEHAADRPRRAVAGPARRPLAVRGA